MGIHSSKMKLASFIAILSVLTTLFVPTQIFAAEERNGTTSDEFTNFRIDKIGASNSIFRFDTIEADNGIDANRLNYILMDSNDALADQYDDSVTDELKTILGTDLEALAVAHPDFLLDMGDGNVITDGARRDLRSEDTDTIELNGLEENRNYRLFVTGSSPELGNANKVEVNTAQTVEPGASYFNSQESMLEGRFIRIVYNGTDGSGNKEFHVEFLDGNSRDTIQSSGTIVENGSNDLELNFGFDFSNETFNLGASDFQYYFTISGKEFQENDSWLLEFGSDGLLKKASSDIINLSNTEFINSNSEKVTGQLFDVDGEILFSTDPFPSLLEGKGNNSSGFNVTGAPSNQDTRYLRGVTSNRKGEVTLRFSDDIAVTAKGYEEIKLIDSEGNDFRDYSQSIELNDDSIEIPYDALDHGERYYVSIPEGSLALQTSNYGLGQFNFGNEFNKAIFYTEKKPEVSSTLFNPGNDTFDHMYSPFSLDPTNEIYRIPELVGVNKVGVGLNQQLVVVFQDKIVLNGNPDGKLEIESSGDDRNLTATAKINENRPNELIVTVEHGESNLKLLRPDTVYDLVIEPGIVKDQYGGTSFAENDTLEVSFKTADGFKNAFLDKSAYELNAGLLQTPSHNIAIDVPKVYIRNVETIHYRQGLAPEAQVAPNLSNVDVEADQDVAYLTVSTNQDDRSMIERGANGKFTATFAGLSADVTQMEITAYDVNENELVTRVFRLQGAPGSEFKNDYVPEITDIFGKRISLYELMQQPDLMRQVLEQIPVSELDRIGVLEPFFAPYNDVP